MSIRLKDDHYPSEKDSFLPTSSPPPPPAYTPSPKKASRVRKALILVGASAALYSLYSVFSHGGPGRSHHGHGLWAMFGGEYRQGWEMVRHGGGRWGDDYRHGHDDLFKDQHDHHCKIDWVEKADEFAPLTLTTPVSSTGYNPSANVTFPDHTKHIVIALAPSVEAELVLIPASVDNVGLVQVDEVDGVASDDEHLHEPTGESDVRIVKMTDEDKVEGRHSFGGRRGAWSGVVIRDSLTAPKKYIITLALPASSCKPLDLTLQGDRLSISKAGLDFAGVKFGRFELQSSNGEDALVQNLHAHEGAIRLSSGAIKGSFNVSRELVLLTQVGAIEANVSLFEFHPRHKHNLTREVDAQDFEGPPSHDGPPPPPGPPPRDGPPPPGPPSRDGPPPHGPPPHGPPHPHGPPPHVIRVLAHADIGAVTLRYTDSSLPSNKTSLISDAKASIGDIKTFVVPGFKGKFVEASRIGSVEYTAPKKTEVTIEKEIHFGPGGFIKGFVGTLPPPPPHHNKTRCADREEEDESDGARHFFHHGEHHHDEDAERELYRFRSDEEPRMKKGRQGERRNRREEHLHHKKERKTEKGERRPPPPPHDGPGGPPPPKGPGGPPPPPGGPGGPPPPPHDGHGGPHGGPPPHHPHPPKGYGFVGSFTKTGSVEVVFL